MVFCWIALVGCVVVCWVGLWICLLADVLCCCCCCIVGVVVVVLAVAVFVSVSSGDWCSDAESFVVLMLMC